MQRLVIIGAGISGLAAAAAAADIRGDHELEILVLEAAGQVGGKAQTIRRDGYLLEAGPTGYLDNEPLMDELVQKAGLQKLSADDAAARRFLVRDGKLREIQASPPRFLTSGILSPRGVLRIATEPFRKQKTAPRDESVWEFAARRLGPQAADRIIAPMVLGVYAGDAKRTSLAAAFPRMAELESEYGSLVKALFALKKQKGKASGGPTGPSGKLTSFAAGLDQLPLKLAERCQAKGEFQVRTGARVESLSFEDGSVDSDSVPGTHATRGAWNLRVASGGATESLRADRLILATEAHVAAKLLTTAAPNIATELAGIPMPHVAVVGLGFGPDALAKAPRGFGALIQRGGGIRILGVLWDTFLFPERSPDGTILMRCMVGGATDPDAAQRTNDELVAIALVDLKKLLNLDDAAPTFTEVVRWPQAIPQYEIGHLARMERIQSAMTNLEQRAPGLHLAGNYTAGVAFAKAAKAGDVAGREAAEQLTRGIARPSST
ncbi:MAG: oxygen-dependent protoporphyrinogen oxidase [Planctomycetota bacterium]|jgi:oxygen-dependent protoporphyrinogen oxidase